jgi:hypothetical protein
MTSDLPFGEGGEDLRVVRGTTRVVEEKLLDVALAAPMGESVGIGRVAGAVDPFPRIEAVVEKSLEAVRIPDVAPFLGAKRLSEGAGNIVGTGVTEQVSRLVMEFPPIRAIVTQPAKGRERIPARL